MYIIYLFGSSLICYLLSPNSCVDYTGAGWGSDKLRGLTDEETMIQKDQLSSWPFGQTLPICCPCSLASSFLAPRSWSARWAYGPWTQRMPGIHPALSRPEMNSQSDPTPPTTFLARKLKSSLLTQKLVYSSLSHTDGSWHSVKYETSESFLMDKDDSKSFKNLLMIIVANIFPLAWMYVSIWSFSLTAIHPSKPCTKSASSRMPSGVELACCPSETHASFL